MLKSILKDPRPIYPFNEHARDLRIQNTPLWLHQRDVLVPYVSNEREILRQFEETQHPDVHHACLVYRDNLHFDQDFINELIDRAKAPLNDRITE